MPSQRDESGPDTSMVRRDDVVAAVNYLIHSRDLTARIKEINEILDRWEERPMIYAGHLMHLNALIDVGLEDREAFEKLVKLINDRRKLLPAMKRVDYQRDLMRQRRSRIAKAVELQELRHGKMDKRARSRFQKEITARWSEAQKDYIKKLGSLTWEKRNQARRNFWETIDKNLSQSIRAERAKKLKKR